MPSVIPTLRTDLSVPLALNLSLMLLFVLLWKLDLSVLPDPSVLQEFNQLPLLALRELLEMKDQHVLLALHVSLEYWKIVCVQREHQELSVTLMLLCALSVLLAQLLNLVLLLAHPELLELHVLPVLSVSQRCKLLLIVLNAQNASHTHQL